MEKDRDKTRVEREPLNRRFTGISVVTVAALLAALSEFPLLPSEEINHVLRIVALLYGAGVVGRELLSLPHSKENDENAEADK